MGHEDRASRAFGEAERLQRGLFPEMPYLTDLWGVAHADFLRRMGDLPHARKIAEANLIVSETENLIDCISLCQRQLGDLDSAAGDGDSAEKRFNEAVRVARSIAERTVLLEALLGRGRWAARSGSLRSADRDLREALRMAEIGGYRIYEADAHTGLAWGNMRMGERDEALRELEHAERLSQQLNYRWGLADVDAVRLAMTT
jgi:tetratricopeptide (TPR) repeat protein